MKLTRLIAWLGLAAFCVAVAIAQAPVITGVKAIGLNISNLERSVDFDIHVLQFSPNSIDAVNSESGQVFNGQGR